MIKKIDIKGGEFTWGQRIALGQIVSDQTKTEYDIANDILECLHGPDHDDVYKCADYLEEIADGLAYWVKKEQEELALEHSAEELEAGYRQFSESVGNMASIISVAKAYGQNPEEVLNWKYATIFMHLKVEVESEKFNRRLQKVYEKKSKQKK